MKKILLVAFIAFLFLLAFTCPDKQAHQDAIKMTCSGIVEDKLSNEGGGLGKGLAMLGSMITGKVVDVALAEKLEVHNYVLFSKGTIKWMGEDKTVSVGVLNNVYTFKEEDLKKLIK